MWLFKWCNVSCYVAMSLLLYSIVLFISGCYLFFWLHTKINRHYLKLVTQKAMDEARDIAILSQQTDSWVQPPIPENESLNTHSLVSGQLDSQCDTMEAEPSYNGTWSCGDSVPAINRDITSLVH
ncbi:uncharacterized protein LOC106056960 [Biomphalaria glabrata]|uniref:Uncharacterized protein LOC106056960 n=1 Tax=Biomphalaria glabrata TaxID=6526 RepID=A0A9W2ZZT1_BIOGL|nr:uncharacterized protein LOC106056960 [Biomphalaria glabrata]